MPRIVSTDNFGGDHPDETFLLWPMRRASAQRIADILNEEPDDDRFYKVEEDDYELRPGFEP